ncbi:WW domain-binding protein 11 [Dionaea muscipula]
MYAHMMHEMLHLETTELEEPQVQRQKGRLKRSSTKREPSGWEYPDRMYPSREDFALLTRSMSTSSGRARGRQGNRCVSFSCVEEAQLKGRVSVCPADKRRLSLSSTDGSQRSTGTSFSFSADMPSGVLPYIRGFVDVRGDGNCGFRVIALSKYGDQDMWHQVRLDLLDEMRNNEELYVCGLQGREYYGRDLHILDCHESPAPWAHWMSTIELGSVIATRY